MSETHTLGIHNLTLKHLSLVPVIFRCLVLCTVAGGTGEVWFDAPASVIARKGEPAGRISFLESLPIGNGRLGAMDCGGVTRERVILNESTVWAGGRYDANKHGAYKALPGIREALFAGDVGKAERLLEENFGWQSVGQGNKRWAADQFGCYQILGDLLLDFPVTAEARPANYRRSLNPMTGLVTTVSITAAETKLWYDRPAANWEQEALPIGNGRLGAMLFGGVGQEHIQFNEESLWIGDEKDIGAYQAFGDVLVSLGGDGISSVECASSQTSSPAQSVVSSIDDKAGTKWCLDHGTEPVVWVSYLPPASVVSSYAFTSRADMPDRDPTSWILEGSNHSQAWTLLDRRTDEASFPERHERREYTFANDRKFQHYRFTFSAFHSPTHFQVAEIQVGGRPTAHSG